MPTHAEIRLTAMQLALEARAGPHDDVFALAERMLAFLDPLDPGHARLLAAQARGDAVTPPPIPDLVQQVAADADLSNADQSPHAQKQRQLDALEGRVPVFINAYNLPDDDTKTRIIHRAHGEQFSEAK